jgi:hypothetical protein
VPARGREGLELLAVWRDGEGMSGSIYTFAIDGSGPYKVIAQTNCQRIEVRENYDLASLPTCDLQQYAAYTTTGPALIAKGTVAVFSRLGYFRVGDEAGRINTASGSCTVVQIEYGSL